MIYVILGKSCSGKTYLADKFCKKYNIKKVTTSTSRPRRRKEDTTDYFFYDYATMKRDIEEGKYIEHAEFKVANGDIWLYGTKFSDIDIEDDCLIVLNPEGYRRLKSIYDYKVVGIYINPPVLIRIYRILKRDVGNYREAFRRFWSDYKDFKNLKDVIEIKKIKDL